MSYLLKLSLTFIMVTAVTCARAQQRPKDYNPFETIGKKARIVTAYGNRFVEVFDTDSLQRIGSVIIHIYDKKVVALLNADSTFEKLSDNSGTSRWYSVDPKAHEFAGYSPYNFVLNNPLRYTDPDGQAPFDIVYFNQQGQEIRRIESNTVFKTYVEVQGTALNANFRNGTDQVPVTTTYEAPMPGVAAGYAGAQYQKHDYQIAATTFLMNREIAKEQSPLSYQSADLPTASKNHTIGTDLPQALDVNIVKAMVLTESGGGTVSGVLKTGKTDVMQVNNSGDWAAGKKQVGLSEGQAMTPESSINAGVKWLFLKGMSSNAQGVMNWRNGQNGDWWNAVLNYNGGGDPGYLQKVQSKVNSMTPAQANNY